MYVAKIMYFISQLILQPLTFDCVSKIRLVVHTFVSFWPCFHFDAIFALWDYKRKAKSEIYLVSHEEAKELF